MGFAVAPPRTEIYLVWSQYGTVSGARSAPKARLFIMTENPDDPDARLVAILATNGPTGHVVYEDLGEVVSVETRASMQGPSAIVTLATGERLSQVAAPCVCGAGAIGYAGPTAERHSVHHVRPDTNNKVTAS